VMSSRLMLLSAASASSSAGMASASAASASRLPAVITSASTCRMQGAAWQVYLCPLFCIEHRFVTTTCSQQCSTWQVGP